MLRNYIYVAPNGAAIFLSIGEVKAKLFDRANLIWVERIRESPRWRDVIGSTRGRVRYPVFPSTSAAASLSSAA